MSLKTILNKEKRVMISHVHIYDGMENEVVGLYEAGVEDPS